MSRSGPRGVAIVGMALRLPGARTADELWQMIAEGRCAVSRFTPAESIAAGVDEEIASSPDYVPVHGTIGGIDEFDAELFGFASSEAAVMDPQHRKFLECAHEALENAGHGRPDGHLRVGVIAGTGGNTYLLRNLIPQVGLLAELGETSQLIASEKDHVATRVAHRLDLRGPAVCVQTSCSTSLVAVHMAAQMLLHDEADVMLAGGATIQVPQLAGHLHSAHGIASADGLCRPFSVGANGTVFGSGVGVVVLRRLSDAVADGDVIHAVIIGSAINNDGSRKVGYTAPSVDGQVAVIRAAHRVAGVLPETIGYVETHGTGTELGDAIEVAALRAAFGPTGFGQDGCVIGTLKPTIGHVDSASGVAGLIKAALVLKHASMPPDAHDGEPNPALGLSPAGFHLNPQIRPWTSARPRRAGVSSFGLGGTNAHLVLEEAPPVAPRPSAVPEAQLVVLSAASEAAVTAMATELNGRLGTHPMELADVAHTLRVGRRSRTWRVAVAGESADQLRTRLATASPRRIVRHQTLGLCFTGFGEQWPGMVATLDELDARFDAFRSALGRCSELLQAHAGRSFDELSQRGDLDDPAVGQPVLVALQFALVEQLGAWGVRPDVVMGHSLGEYVAACAAGGMGLEDTFRLVIARNELFAKAPPGAMTAVLADAAWVRTRLGDELSLAALNGPRSVVVSGPVNAVRHLETELDTMGVRHRRLRISVAAHSSMLDVGLDEFRRVAESVEFSPFTTDFVSTVTGSRLPAGTCFDADYWIRHIRQPVLFESAVRDVAQSRRPVLVEVGPGQTLGNLIAAVTEAVPTVPTLPGARDDLRPDVSLMQALGDLWAMGVDVDLEHLRPTAPARRVQLPGHPLSRARHWIEPPGAGDVQDEPPAGPGSIPPLGDAKEGEVQDDQPLVVRLAQIWSGLLGQNVTEDGEANFFALGGDSLMLVRLIARLRDEFGVQIPLRSIAAAPVLGSMASLVERAQVEGIS